MSDIRLKTRVSCGLIECAVHVRGQVISLRCTSCAVRTRECSRKCGAKTKRALDCLQFPEHAVVSRSRLHEHLKSEPLQCGAQKLNRIATCRTDLQVRAVRDSWHHGHATVHSAWFLGPLGHATAVLDGERSTIISKRKRPTLTNPVLAILI